MNEVGSAPAEVASHLLTLGWAVPQLDTSVAHPARMYDYYLDGHDNYQVDRDAADQVIAVMPQVRPSARHNRAFLARAVRFLARAGITQFLDIGTGIPGPGNVGEVAHQITPDARIACVDNDPLVLTHAGALLADSDPSRTMVLHGDLRDPDALLADAALRAAVDLSRPIAVLLVAVLHFIPDPVRPGDADPYRVVRTLMDAAAPGSYLVISHGTADFDQNDAVAGLVEAYQNAAAPAVPRRRDQITPFFDGLDLIEPGVVQIPWWHPDGQVPADADQAWMYGGVARKTGPARPPAAAALPGADNEDAHARP